MRNYLKPNTTHSYFGDSNFILQFSKMYSENFDNEILKVIRCTKLLNVVKDVEDQILLIKINLKGELFIEVSMKSYCTYVEIITFLK